MANIKLKSINSLETWTTKELRKLRMTLRNRIESLKTDSKVKDLPAGHPLKDLSLEGCLELLDKVQRAEKLA